MAYKIKKYKGWKVQRISKGKAKGLIYAEKKEGKNKRGIGIIAGENTWEELKEVLDKIKK